MAGLINDMVAFIEDLPVQISNQTSTRSNLIGWNINLIDQIDVRDYRIDVPTRHMLHSVVNILHSRRNKKHWAVNIQCARRNIESSPPNMDLTGRS